jgi:adenylylsulfate kinase
MSNSNGLTWPTAGYPAPSVRPCVIWLSGLSGAGKTTLAQALRSTLRARGEAVTVLDGDHLRQGLCKDLSYSPADRHENLRRAGEVCSLMTDAGLIVIAAFVSPFQADRDMVRAMLGAKFIEVFCDAPLDVCEARDVKGLYAKARQGLIPEFTGVSAPYEVPLAPELRLDTARQPVADNVARVMALLAQYPLTAPYTSRMAGAALCLN